MTIVTTAPHGILLDALSRAAVLISEHRDQLPPLHLQFFPHTGQVAIQVAKAGAGPDETARRAAVDLLVSTLHLTGAVLEYGEFYGARNDLWDVFTTVARTDESLPAVTA